MTTDDERDRAGAIFPPPLIYIFGFLAGWLLDRWFALSLPESGVIDFIGGLMVGVAIALAIVAASELYSASTTFLPYRPTTTIVDTGAFKHTRNPIYVADTLAYVGLSLMLGTIGPLLLLPLVLLVVDRGVIAREERYLSRKFGDEYDVYRSRVRRWI
jgi:protein-S-isoprenylcysteine O-methyltransferase Ste14